MLIIIIFQYCTKLKLRWVVLSKHISDFFQNIRAIYTRKNKTRLTEDANCTIYTSMSYLIRRDLAKPRLILDEMCRLCGKRRVLFFLV